jgi:agmatine/peptidylarginine deiminase
VSEGDFASYDGVLQMGIPPLRIDIINRADGITFDEAIADGTSMEVDGRTVPVIGRAALLKNKRASGREQDLADLKILEQFAASGTRSPK